MASNCSHAPKLDVKFWAGDSKNDGISRAQDHKTILARDPAFDDYACLTYQDIAKIYNLIQQCQKWPDNFQEIKTP